MYDALTDLVKDKKLTFPDSVLGTCKRFAGDEVATMWANAVSGHRKKYVIHYSFEQKVLGKCPELLDVDDDSVASHVDVATMALCLSETLEVKIVSEDELDGEGRISMHNAAPILGLDCEDAVTFLARHGLDGYLI